MLRTGIRTLVIGGLLALLGACTPEPARIQIKGPRDSIESTRANPKFRPFTKKNDTLQLRTSAFDQKQRFMGTIAVKWDSSDRSVATVSQGGLITILSSGKATIKATTTETKTKLTAQLPIEAIIVEDIRITSPKIKPKKSLDIAMGEKIMIEAEVLNDHGEVIPDAKVRWRTTGWAATILPNGELEGRAIGSTQVTAEAANGSVARLEVSVGDWKKPGRKKR